MMKNGFIITFCALTLMTAFSCEKTEKEDNGGGGNTTPEIPEGLADLPDTIRIGTYNLRVSTDNGINSWEQRRGRLVQSIAENDFDVFGVQEADITGMPGHVVRMMVVVGRPPVDKPSMVYLRGAAALRPDLAGR